MKRHLTGFYHAIVMDDAPTLEFRLPDGRWLARMPLVVGAATGLSMWVAVAVGVLYAA